MKAPRETAAREARGHELRQLCTSMGWSIRDLAIYLGEHLTWVSQWSRDERPVPAEVLPWLARVAAPYIAQPAAYEGPGVPSDMTGEQMEALRIAMRLDKLQLARRLHLQPAALARRLQGQQTIQDNEAGWMRTTSAALLQEPLPPGWERNVEVLPGMKSRVLPNNARQKAKEARKAAEGAKSALASQERAKRIQKAVGLRSKGLSFPEIARLMGYASHYSVWRLVREEEAKGCDAA